MKPKKVLILIDRLGQGGVAQVAMNVALVLDRDKYEPIICTTRDKPSNGQDEVLLNAGIQLLALNRKSRLQLSSWIPLVKLLPEITVLHTHSSGSNLWGRLWGTLYRVPVIVTQEHKAVVEKKKPTRLLDRFLAHFSDKIITVSKYDQQQYQQAEKLPADKLETVYVGIDTDRFSTNLSKADAQKKLGIPENKWVIGVVARLVPQKNHEGFLKALALLPDELKANVHCLFVGNGDLKDSLADQAKELGFGDQLSFLGERQDIPDILRAMDLLALPSFWECLPSVISEGMSAGCPVVATDVGGVPEMINAVGWPLVPPGDEAALAEAITEVWRMSAEEREQKIAKGRQHVLKFFNRDASVAHLERLYDSLIEEKSSSSKWKSTTSKSHP